MIHFQNSIYQIISLKYYHQFCPVPVLLPFAKQILNLVDFEKIMSIGL